VSDGEAEKSEEKKARLQESDQMVDPMNPPVAGEEGPPRSCTWKGYEAPFHEWGSALPSKVGTWKKEIPYDTGVEAGTQEDF
jgi:hypothetical protein